MTKVTKLAVLIMGGLLVSRTWAQADGAAKIAKTNQAPAESMSKSVAAPDYWIAADSNLPTLVWRGPELSPSVPGRPGRPSFLPLVQNGPAAARTPMTLQD